MKILQLMVVARSFNRSNCFSDDSLEGIDVEEVWTQFADLSRSTVSRKNIVEKALSMLSENTLKALQGKFRIFEYPPNICQRLCWMFQFFSKWQ